MAQIAVVNGETATPSDWRQLDSVTVKEAAAILRMTTWAYYNAARTGHLPAIRTGPRRMRVPTAELDALLRAGATRHPANVDDAANEPTSADNRPSSHAPARPPHTVRRATGSRP